MLLQLRFLVWLLAPLSAPLVISCIKNWDLSISNKKRWIRRLCLLHKYIPARKPSHIHNLLPPMRNSYRHPNAFHVFSCRTECFKRLFFIYTSFMNGKNLIQSFVTLVVIYFVMQCRNL